jgi:hypothetical protein
VRPGGPRRQADFFAGFVAVFEPEPFDESLEEVVVAPAFESEDVSLFEPEEESDFASDLDSDEESEDFELDREELRLSVL